MNADVASDFDAAAIIASVSDELPVGVWVARAPRGEFVYANREFAEIMGMTPRGDVSRGEWSQPYGIYRIGGALYPEDQLPFPRAIAERRQVSADDIVIHRADGKRVNVRAYARPVFNESGEISHVVVAFFDITREVEAQRLRAESEARLARAQRMEAIGKLAGGIAHDFNNLLTAIRTVASRLAARETDGERLSDLKMIDDVAERATQLTRALLGFAGRGKNFSAAVSLHAMVEEMIPLLRRTLDPRIQVTLELGALADRVAGDLSQLEQVLMNLMLNARDAMPEGGRLLLRTSDLELKAGDPRCQPPLTPGPHVMVEVIDSGSGIPAEIRERIFEPYFTTKIDGETRGSGLGLATAYGIVESHLGTIEAVDASGGGTVMRMIFPAAVPPDARTQRSERGLTLTGTGTVLLVEDEPLVRVATFRTLKQLGYRVIACADGDEAVDIFREQHGELAAVMLDMMMPRMGGRQTYLAMREINPEVPVLLTTGFAHNEEVQRILDLGVRGFIAKPYEMTALSQALAKVIATRA